MPGTIIETQIMMDRWKYIFVGLILLISSRAFAQLEETDTALLRKLKVEHVEQKAWMAIYGERADTCIEGEKWYNERGLITREIIDYSCSGWDMVIENEYEYDDHGNLVKLISLSNDVISEESTYEYNDHNDVVYSESKGFDPPMVYKTRNVYYYNKKGRKDSTYQYSITENDTDLYRVIYVYTKKGDISKEKVYDQAGVMIREDHNVYDANGNITEVNVEITRPEYAYSKTILEYNEEGQIHTTLDTDSGSSIERWYNRDGLLIMTNHFNRFGNMEKQVHYIYTFRK